MARGTVISRTLQDGTKRYYAALWVEKPGGGRKQIWRTFEKKRDAEAFLDEKSKEVREGDFVEPSKMSFDEFAKEWQEKYPRLAKQPMKPSTLAGYGSLIEAHLTPFFGRLRLSQIRSSTIEADFKAQLPERLSPKTKRNILLVLRRMLESAVEWDYLPVNPFRARKRVNLPTASKEQKGRALTPEEIRELLEKCTDDTHAIVATALLTGMRRGEVFGLEWPQVDFEKKQIHVRQALYWKRGKFWRNGTANAGNQQESGPAFIFVKPKSNASIRDIDMGPALRRILLEHKMRSGNPDSGLVFKNSAGNPVDPDNFVKRLFLPAVAAAAIGKVRFHDLRHTFGSLKIAQGENLKYVQVQMGHSDIKITLDVYGHLLKDSNPEAAAKTDALIFGKQIERAENR